MKIKSKAYFDIQLGKLLFKHWSFYYPFEVVAVERRLTKDQEEYLQIFIKNTNYSFKVFIDSCDCRYLNLEQFQSLIKDCR